MKKFFKEFKEFISKGNVVDMAIGVIIGSAFSKIVSSVVNDLMMPIIGIIIGGHDFSSFKLTVGSAEIKYGTLLQNILDFLIVAFCLFLCIKFINRFKRKEEKKVVEKVKSDELIVLEEIRDALEKETKKKPKK